MNKNGICLVVLDVDGTIVDSPRSHTVTPELCRTVRRVAERGVYIGLASGRNYGHIMSQMREIGFTGPFICNNGGFLVLKDEILGEALLNQEVLAAAWRQVREQKCFVEFSGRSIMHTYRAPGYSGPVFPRVGTDNYLDVLDGSRESFEQIRGDHISKITIVVDTPEKAKEITAFWEEGPLREYVAVTDSFWYALEITHPSASKGSGLRTMAEKLGIPLSRTMAIGDGDNDVDLLRTAGVSFAMENGSEAARRAARFRAPPVSADGARQVLERYVLNDEPLPVL